MTDNFKMCLELTEELEKHKKRINQYKQQLKNKEQECEELKEQLTILNDEDVVVEITVEQFEEYKKLKAENEDLEKWKKEHLKDVEFIEKNPVIDILNSMADNILLEQRNDKLKQTLTEIKEIAEVLITTTDEYDSCYYKDRCSKCEVKEDCQYFKVEQILQKISEVEDG